MPQSREAIPRELERALLMEAGYRCAIPTCRVTGPLEIDHIDDYARVQEHRFENMIVLCRNCHGLKGDRRRQLDRKALRQYKANLAIINGRYGDLERRVLLHFAENPRSDVIDLPGGLDMLLMYLMRDHLLEPVPMPISFALGGGAFVPMRRYTITPAGRDFLKHWIAAEPLDDYPDD